MFQPRFMTKGQAVLNLGHRRRSAWYCHESEGALLLCCPLHFCSPDLSRHIYRKTVFFPIISRPLFADLAIEVGNLECERANTSDGNPEEQRAVRGRLEGAVVVPFCFCKNLGPVAR